MDTHKSLFYQKMSDYYSKNKDAKKPWSHDEIKEATRDMLLAKQTSGKKTRRQYHLLNLYDTMEVGNRQVLIKKRLEESDDIIYITPYEDLFDVLYSTHIGIGHGSRDKMLFSLKSKYQIARPVVEAFLQSCEVCNKKKTNKHANLVTKPIISKEFCSRAQIDLIDYQSCQDGEYKWLLNYQDHLTKFICLRPLKSKQSIEVASELLKIFLEFGAPAILQSDNGREFVNGIITELVKLWPELKIIHGRPRHPQSQGSIERCNQDVENMLRAWMLDNNSTGWSIGCYFVQFQKNCSLHRIIGRSPYRALFGTNPKIGLSSTTLPSEIIKTVQTEEELNKMLSKLQEREEEVTSDLRVTNLNNDASEEQTQDLEIPFGMEVQTNIEVQEVIIDPVNPLENSNNTIIEIMDTNANSELMPFADLQEKIKDPQAAVICVDCSKEKNPSCILCSLQTTILSNRNECHLGQKKAAEKMLSNTAKKLTPFKIGDCVLLSVEKIDRGPSDMPNLMCVIVDCKNGVYQLGSAVGKIKGWYNRSDIVVADSQFLDIKDVPDKYISIREAVSGVSLCHGQGYFKCSCKPSKKQCQTNRCACLKKKVMCNSRCHNSA